MYPESILNSLSPKIQEAVHPSGYNVKRRLFICGANPNDKKSIRSIIARYLLSGRLDRFRNEILFPEDLFEELISGQGKSNLLTLENELALGVDAIIIICESYGSVAELGAFSNHPDLSRKLICIVDEKYKNDKSFLNRGPLGIVKKHSASRVIHCDFASISEDSIQMVKRAIWNVAMSNAQHDTERGKSLFDAPGFVIAALFVFDTLRREDLERVIQNGIGIDVSRARAFAAASISLLKRSGHLVSSESGFQLSQKGLDTYLYNSRSSQSGHVYDKKTLDNIRFQILANSLRGRNIA